MNKSLCITAPRLDNHDNGFSLTLNGEWFDLANTHDLRKLNEHNLRLLLKMDRAYEKALAEFNQQFVDKYASQVDTVNALPVETYDAYCKISDEIDEE